MMTWGLGSLVVVGIAAVGFVLLMAAAIVRDILDR